MARAPAHALRDIMAAVCVDRASRCARSRSNRADHTGGQAIVRGILEELADSPTLPYLARVGRVVKLDPRTDDRGLAARWCPGTLEQCRDLWATSVCN